MVNFNYLGEDGYRVCYPGTNAELADNGSSNLSYLNSSKKTIQLDNTQDVTGDDISNMMVNYLKTGKIEGGDIDSDGSVCFRYSYQFPSIDFR